jgi:hypothetical protein
MTLPKRSKEVEDRINLLLKYHSPQSVTAELVERNAQRMNGRSAGFFNDHYWTLYEVYTQESYAKQTGNKLRKDYKLITAVRPVSGMFGVNEYALYVR